MRFLNAHTHTHERIFSLLLKRHKRIPSGFSASSNGSSPWTSMDGRPRYDEVSTEKLDATKS